MHRQRVTFNPAVFARSRGQSHRGQVSPSIFAVILAALSRAISVTSRSLAVNVVDAVLVPSLAARV